MDNALIIAIDLDKQREAILSHYKKAALELAECGRLLLEAKHSLENDETFEAFVQTLPFSRRSAYNFMRIHEHVLRHGSATVALEQIRIASWYIAPPENEELVQAMIEKSKTGKVTPQDVRALLSTVKIDDDRTALAWHGMADENPAFVIESIARGAVTDFDGNDVPIEDAEPSFIQYQALQDKHEREMRQKQHIQESAKSTKRALSFTPELILVGDEKRLAFPKELPITALLGKQITVYIETEEQAA